MRACEEATTISIEGFLLATAIRSNGCTENLSNLFIYFVLSVRSDLFSGSHHFQLARPPHSESSKLKQRPARQRERAGRMEKDYVSQRT